MEDLKLDDEPLPVLSSEGAGSLRAILIARECGTLGRLPPRCISSKFSSHDTSKTQPGISINAEVKLDKDSSNETTLQPPKKTGLIGPERLALEAAEERLAGRELKVSECDLQGRQTRSAFLVVFSPDRDLMASTHGDHNIYVSSVSNGKCVRTLKGHPRTPWCVAFHPTRKGLLASGCLGGHVRLWDLMGDGSEVWKAEGVVASLAFHPTDRLLVIATFNELHFWDWSQSLPFAKVTTASEKEKVRYVKFDSIGHQLITGIANLSGRESQSPNTNANSMPGNQYNPPYMRRSFEQPYITHHEYLNMRARNNIGNVEGDGSYGLSAYARYRSGLPFSHSSMRRATETNTLLSRTTIRGPNQLLSSNHQPPSSSYSIPFPRTIPTSRFNETMETRNGSNHVDVEASDNRDLPGSASQTLSDLAAAASNRLMAENAAETAASHHTSRPELLRDPYTSDNTFFRRDIHGALRSARDPFLGSNLDQSDRSAGLVSNNSNLGNIGNTWATTEEIEAIRQSQIQQLRDLREIELRDPVNRSTIFLPPDIDSLMGQDEEINPLREYSPSFSHSPESSFVEVTGTAATGRSINVPQYNGTNRTQVYTRTTARQSRARVIAQARYRAISERRLKRLLGRRQALVSQIEDLTNTRDYLTNMDRRRSSDIGRDIAAGSSNREPAQHDYSNPDLDTRTTESNQSTPDDTTRETTITNENTTQQDRSHETSASREAPSSSHSRVIDDWARDRRRRIEFAKRINLQSDSYQIRRSYNHRGSINLTANSQRSVDHQENHSMNLQSENTHTVARELSSSATSHQSSLVENTERMTENLEENYPATTVEPEVVATPESSMFNSLSSATAMRSNLNPLGQGGIEETQPTSDMSLVRDMTSHNVPQLSIPNAEVNQQLDAGEATHNDHTYSNQDGNEIAPQVENAETGTTVENNISNSDSNNDSNFNLSSNLGSRVNSRPEIMPSPENINNRPDLNLDIVSTNAAVNRSNMDIMMLSRHIDHMQRICRASLADCALNRHRRQVVRLQSIRRMLEDLQRQIRCLRAASNEEINRRSREAESLGSVLGSFRSQNQQPISNDRTLDGESNSISVDTLGTGNHLEDIDRGDEEEGHFDLVDEDSLADVERAADVNPEVLSSPSDETNRLISRTRGLRRFNRLNTSNGISSSNYELRPRAYNRNGRLSVSGRLRRASRQSNLLGVSGFHRNSMGIDNITANQSSQSSPSTSSHTMRTSTEMQITTPSDITRFERGSNGRSYIRGRVLRRRALNSNISTSTVVQRDSRSLHRTRSTRLSRVHNQLFSQLRATVRAMERGPQVAESDGQNTIQIKKLQQNKSEGRTTDPSPMAKANTDPEITKNKISRILPWNRARNKATNDHQPSRCLVRKQARKGTKSSIETKQFSSTKAELRALSQRLEKLVKDRRENRSQFENLDSNENGRLVTLQDHSEESSQSRNDEYSLSEGERYLMSLPRPDTGLTSPNERGLSDPRLRWRHLMEGIDDHILNDPMPPRRTSRYGLQRYQTISSRDDDFYIRHNYRSERRDTSPLIGRIRGNRLRRPSAIQPIDGTLPNEDIPTDSGSDTDETTRNLNDSRNFPHNSSLEWSGGTSSFRHGFGRWPLRRISRREGLDRNQGRSLSPNRHPHNDEDERRHISNRLAARNSRLSRQHRLDNLVNRELSIDIQSNRIPDSLIRARSPISSTFDRRINGGFDNTTHQRFNHSVNQGHELNIDTEESDTGPLDMDRLPPLRELIWRRLRRRNAQLNMLENEIAGTSNMSSHPNNVGHERSIFPPNNNTEPIRNASDTPNASDINRPHREFLSWMVDQMRLDQESGTSSDAVSRRINALGNHEAGVTTNSDPADGTERNDLLADPSTRHISFSREFITPPPIQYRHRLLNLDTGINDASITTANDNIIVDSRRMSVREDARRLHFREDRLRPTTYAAAASTGVGLNRQSGGVSSSTSQGQAAAATFQREHYYLHNAPANMLLTHRIQSWDFKNGDIPDLRDSNSNLVVNEARIHNDASVDISEDGSILVTLIPSNMPMTTVVGVYALKPNQKRGRCYATYSLESSAVSVSLSPTSRYLLVGLAVRTGRITLSPTDRTLIAQIFRIQLPHERSANAERGRLIHRKDLHQTEHGQTSLNCIRWIPVAGQGIVYATNTGLLKILR